MYRDSHLDIETLHGYFVGQAFSRHMHDYYVIGLIHKGLQTFRYRGTIRQQLFTDGTSTNADVRRQR